MISQSHWSSTVLGNKPKKFDFVHQTVSRREACMGGHETILFLGETFFASSIIAYWPLAVSMPPTKVFTQFKAAVPVRQKTCERCDLVL